MLELRGITKQFGVTKALDDVSFTVNSGEVHALLGENGAGKSTLIRILSGDHRPDEGTAILDGQVIELSSPAAALAQGIGFIHQHQQFVPSRSVTENLRLGYGYTKRFGTIDWAEEHRQAHTVLDSLGIAIDPRTRMGDLEIHETQFVALARALSRKPRLLLLDEVTASLTAPEVSRLFAVLRKVVDTGVGVIYVSHRLEETFDLSAHVTVLRDGRHIETAPTSSLTRDRVCELIVGRAIQPSAITARPEDLHHTDPVLRVAGLGDDEAVHNAAFEVFPGEIVGIAGLVAAGKHDLVRLIFGDRRATTGTMQLDGQPFNPRHPADAIKAGVVMVTEDRSRDGYVPNFPLWKNVMLPWSRQFRRVGIVQLRRERRAAGAHVKRLRVKAPHLHSPMSELSGGNQQKAIMARWTAAEPRLLLLGDPTHGVDVGSRAEIYEIVRAVAANGAGVIVASEDLEELATISHRVLLMRSGRIVGEIAGDIDDAKILSGLLTTSNESGSDHHQERGHSVRDN